MALRPRAVSICTSCDPEPRTHSTTHVSRVCIACGNSPDRAADLLLEYQQPDKEQSRNRNARYSPDFEHDDELERQAQTLDADHAAQRLSLRRIRRLTTHCLMRATYAPRAGYSRHTLTSAQEHAAAVGLFSGSASRLGIGSHNDCATCD